MVKSADRVCANLGCFSLGHPDEAKPEYLIRSRLAADVLRRVSSSANPSAQVASDLGPGGLFVACLFMLALSLEKQVQTALPEFVLPAQGLLDS